MVLEKVVPIPAAGVVWQADVAVPDDPVGLVLFAHGSARARRSPWGSALAGRLGRAGLVTIRTDLLAPHEQYIDERAARLRFDVGLLAGRLVAAVDWLWDRPQTARLPVGLFSDGTGAAAALFAAVRRPAAVQAMVFRDGRPDRVGSALGEVHAPTLFIVSERDSTLVTLSRQAAASMCAPCQLQLASDSTISVQAAATDHIAGRASQWFTGHLDSRSTDRAAVAKAPSPAEGASAPSCSDDGPATATPW
ncbi:hydrolase [Dactylosporangium sp. CA-139066]|uniref:hydrolase n=1 Tax=Dactylosporangium sp. CA-139066 TaxID=3239930 RepID=UPI003D93985D